MTGPLPLPAGDNDNPNDYPFKVDDHAIAAERRKTCVVWHSKPDGTPLPGAVVHGAEGSWAALSYDYTIRLPQTYCGKMVHDASVTVSPNSTQPWFKDSFPVTTSVSFFEEIECLDCLAAVAASRLVAIP